MDSRTPPRTLPRTRIAATGLYVPPRVETAADLAERTGRSEEWIRRRVGVERRHVADIPVEQMAAAAARDALGDGPPPDLVVHASVTQRQYVPDTSVFVLRELGLSGVPGFSVHATCLSFLAAFRAVSALVASGAYRRALVVSAEIATVGRDMSQPESAALLGDGAAAAIVEPTPAGEAGEILAWSMVTFPEGAELTEVRGVGMNRHPLDPGTRPEDYLFDMDGPGVYRLARAHVKTLVKDLEAQSGLGIGDLDLVVPHQASSLVLRKLARALRIPEDKVVVTLPELGNSIAAGLPMALATADREGRLRRGDAVLLIGSGAGLSVGGALLRW